MELNGAPALSDIYFVIWNETFVLNNRKCASLAQVPAN